MSFYKDFLALGYSESEALELAHLAESFVNPPGADDELDETTKIIIDKFNELGCTSFRMSADELAKVMERGGKRVRSLVDVVLIDEQGVAIPIPEAKPVKHGCKWCCGEEYNTIFHVTVNMLHHRNGGLSSHKIKAIYCPNCGAKLDQTYRGG